MFGYLGRTFAFTGRARRTEIWVMSVIMTLALLAAGFVYGMVLVMGGATTPPDPATTNLVGTVLSAVLLAGVSVRRLHDRGKEAWWLVTYWLMPSLYIGVANPAKQLESGAAMVPWQAGLLALAGGVMLWSFIDLYVLPAAKGADRFGPDPKTPLEPNVEHHFT